MLEAAERSAQKTECSGAVAFLEMVEGRCELNQCLKETLGRLFKLEPDNLPMFMGIKEKASPVAGEAFCEFFGVPIETSVEIQVEGHSFSLS